MVVVSSRLEAVRWKLAINKYIKEHGYGLGTLVAFSGEVKDKESGPDPFSETSQSLNPNLRGRDIREAFNTDEFQILLVANKFQTGFDQPLLCGMYVDKRLAGIQAVQTLSRLNRAHPGKDTTYVLDFVNDTEEVLKAFRTYYSTAELANASDPNLVYNLRAKLDAAGFYDDFEVDRVVAVELKPNARQSELAAAVEPVVDRLQKRYKAAQEALRTAQDQNNKPAIEAAKGELDALLLFQSDMGAFLRIYTFLSQIFDYGNTAIEKRSIFYKQVLRLLEFGREREGIDLSKVVLTHHSLKDQGKRPMSLATGDKAALLTPAKPTELPFGFVRSDGMRPIGTAEELQRRRLRAVELVEQGESPDDVARFLGCGRSSVYTWVKLARESLDTLAAKPHPGANHASPRTSLRSLRDCWAKGPRPTAGRPSCGPPHESPS